MKYWTTFMLLIISNIAFAQNFEELTFGTDTTLEIVSWNIEWFPKETATAGYVTDIIQNLDADILAIQEVNDTVAFKQMMDDLPAYKGYFKSSWFAGLAYIYKPAVVEIDTVYEIYTISPYWSAFPRSPMVMEMYAGGEKYYIINNHFKCCGDGQLDTDDPDDEENRRLEAVTLLKEYLDTELSEEQVIVVGDLNDELTDDATHNVFQDVLADSANHRFADYPIAAGDEANWSYPGWPSHLDHIWVTNELFADVEEGASSVTTLKLGNYFTGGFWAYESQVSDHRPVALKFSIDMATNVNQAVKPAPTFYAYPNPSARQVTLCMPGGANARGHIAIYKLDGQKIKALPVGAGQKKVVWQARGAGPGLYIARWVAYGHTTAQTRISIVK